MKDWKQIQYSDTFKEAVDNFNINSENSDFIDKMTGTILCNGVLFTGKETIDGELILPLQNAKSSGVVNSDTILDNFKLYFRDENKLVEVDQFPIDLLSYNDEKLHFIFIKSDLTYRISDYMFGRADEVLLGRFVITASSTWNQFYLMAQRCGTPMYDAADEFYEVEGMYVKSPSGLNLSQESGTVKRSGIEFIDYNSPDIYEFYNLASEKVPIRYVNESNEVDYTQEPTYEVISNAYMEYNMNKKLKVQAEEYINDIYEMTYGLENYAKKYADELTTAILAEETEEVKQSIIDNYLISITNIYELVDKLYELLGDKTLSDSVKRTPLYSNKTTVNTYIDTNLKNIISITTEQVVAITTTVDYIKLINKSVEENPLESVLDTIQDELKDIEFDKGTIKSVDEGKFTLQRILWDIYDRSLIVQYGDTVYDTYDEAVAGSELLAYPAPFGKTIYIPLAVLMIKSGITSINEDEDTLIVSRRWVVVDQLQEGFTDYVARAKAQKALDLINGIESKIESFVKEIANTVVNEKFEKAYPVGYILYSEIGTNPSEYLGFGTWKLYGQGQVLVGYNSSDSTFNTVGKTGGSKTTTLSVSNLPSHTHNLGTVKVTTRGTWTYNDPDVNHSQVFRLNETDSLAKGVTIVGGSGEYPPTGEYSLSGDVSYTGSGASFNNLQPYKVVYIYKRTA